MIANLCSKDIALVFGQNPRQAESLFYILSRVTAALFTLQTRVLGFPALSKSPPCVARLAL